MKRRVIALCAVCCLLLSFAACRVRVDFTEEKDTVSTIPTTSTTIPQNNDEMAAQAWEIYSRALEIEDGYTTYELVYEGRQKVIGEEAVTKARMVRVERENAESLLIESEYGNKYSAAYYADGIGYFNVDGKKYWMPTDEENVYEVLNFSETEDLSQEMFTKAIVIRNEDGGATVSCPLQAKYALQFARMYLGDSAVGSNVTRAEAGVTVDADGNPQAFTSAVTIQHNLYGTVSVESENRYVAVGDAVVLTPPSDLDTYSSIIE